MSLLTMIFGVTLGGPALARAWGVYNSTAATMMSYLVYPVIETSNINYCLKIDDARFEEKNLDTEIQFALRLWLSHLPELGIKKVALTKVDCAFDHLNLWVDLGPDTGHQDLGGYEFPVREKDRMYSFVKIDTHYAYKTPQHEYHYKDLAWLIQNTGFSLARYLYKISFAQPMDAHAVAADLQVDHDTIYWTTYKVLVHEFGHSFGLCDTYDAGIKYCDPELMSAAQPSSVMKNSEYFYLTDDDVTGFNALFKDYVVK
jgi:hypothetical protein